MRKNKRKISIIGHFGKGRELLNGQTIKTKSIFSALKNKYGISEVCDIDTSGGFKALFKLPFQIFGCLKNSKNIIILPAQRGVRVIVPLLTFFNIFFHRSLHYCVIGGWLPAMIKNKKSLRKKLQSFNRIYVETETMKKALESQNFKNIIVMPNCKELVPLSEKELIYSNSEPLKLCIFSRILKEKGIEDAVFAVKKVNSVLNRKAFVLDIYGEIDDYQTLWFENLRKDFPDFIQYHGKIEYQKSVDTIKKYFALLFPTNYYTEGIPGTIIDAYFSGVPVIASRWESFSDIVMEEKTGIGYEFGKADELYLCLRRALNEKELFNKMKNNCLSKAIDFLPNTVIEKFQFDK